MTLALIEPTGLRAELANSPDTLVVDVRTPGEFRAGHIPGAVNLPLDQVDAHLRRIVADAGGRLVLVCQSGGRAGQACEQLTRAGLEDLQVLDGGMNSWIAAAGPVDRADAGAAWPIERQVRLIAGGIVLGSILVSVAWPPAKFAAGAVGAGLTFAALSDTCAMGAVLARMPFNAAPDADVDRALHRIAG